MVRDPTDIPASFLSLENEPNGRVTIVVREDVDLDAARPILEAIASVAWGEHEHAYGSASDVENQLIALVVGDGATRKSAWWNLWGNVHHQGTLYSATVPAVPILGDLSRWRAFPDRVESLLFLAEVANAPGVVVAHVGENYEVTYDEDAQAALTHKLVALIDEVSRPLLSLWKIEPEQIRRSLLWLLSALPHLHENYSELIEAELPGQFEAAWTFRKRGAVSDAEYDDIQEFESWVLSDA